MFADVRNRLKKPDGSCNKKYTPKKKSKISDANTEDATKIKKNIIEGDLFDKNGKLILTNFKFDN